VHFLAIHGRGRASSELNCLQTLEEEASVIVLVLPIRKFEFFQESFDPVAERALPAEEESALHTIALFFWRVFQHFFERRNCGFELKGIEVVKAGELTIAASELTQDHGRVLELIAKVLDEDVLKASQVETVFER